MIRSPLAKYVSLRARMRSGDEERILSHVRLEGDHFVMDLEDGSRLDGEVETTRKQVSKAIERDFGGEIK